jgi:hypothetical protein
MFSIVDQDNFAIAGDDVYQTNINVGPFIIIGGWGHGKHDKKDDHHKKYDKKDDHGKKGGYGGYGHY